MATFYFNGAVDDDWQTLGNWWIDSAFSAPATSLPTSADDVIASASIASNSGSEPTVANFTLNDPTFNYVSLSVAIAVTGNATFNDGTSNGGTVTGNSTFNDFAYNYITGTVSGDGTFNNGANNYGSVTGSAAFNEVALNRGIGTISGDAIFNDNSQNRGTVNSNATFNDSSINNGGTVNGDGTFNGSSYNYSSDGGLGNATFNDSSLNYGTIGESAVFNDNSGNGFDAGSYWVGTVSNAVFNDLSYSSGNIESGIFNDYSLNTGSLLVAGNNLTTFNDSARNDWDAGLSPLNTGIIYGDGTVSFNDNSTNSAGGFISINGTAIFNHNGGNNGVIANHAIFNHNTTNYISDYTAAYNPDNQAYGCYSATFNGNSINNGTIQHNVTFNDSSSNGANNQAWIGGDATFNDSSFAYPGYPTWSVADPAGGNLYSGIVTFSNSTPYPIKRGINSSIIGFV